jgi:hypothetical protein
MHRYTHGYVVSSTKNIKSPLILVAGPYIPLGLVRLALNPCGLSGIGWVWILNKSNFFSIFSNPIQSMCIENNRTSPYTVQVFFPDKLFITSGHLTRPAIIRSPRFRNGSCIRNGVYSIPFRLIPQSNKKIC